MKYLATFCILAALVMAGCDSVSSLTGASESADETVAFSKKGSSSNSTVIVTANDLADDKAAEQANPTSWFFYNDENDQVDNSLGSFVAGPAPVPHGAGSAQISVSGTQRRNLATYLFSGTPLVDITELSYTTYNPTAGNGGGANRSAYLQFNVDFDGSDTWQRRLVYVPALNGTVLQDEWQAWDAIANGEALWRYSGPAWPGTAVSGTTSKTWSDVLAEYPGVRVRVTDSFLGLRVGEPYANGYTENIDSFVFGTADGTTIYDFEPLIGPPAGKDECKYGGWQQFNDPSFQNQGQCIQYVNTGK